MWLRDVRGELLQESQSGQRLKVALGGQLLKEVQVVRGARGVTSSEGSPGC
jgi:hypothetical protein